MAAEASGYKASGASPEAKGVWLDFRNFKASDAFAVTLNGAAGLKVDAETGLIQNVEQGSPSEKQGVEAGMRIATLAGLPFSEKNWNRQIARQTDFAVVVAQSASVDFPGQREEGFTVKTFQGGGIGVGVTVDPDTLRVLKIEDGSQAFKQGVETGMLCRLVDGQPYTDRNLREKAAGKESFEVVFLWASDVNGSEKRHGTHMISRNIPDLPDGPAWVSKNADFSWMEAWTADSRVPDYLGRFGYKAESCMQWSRCPSETVRLGIKVESHVDRPLSKVGNAFGVFGKAMDYVSDANHTWYAVDCNITKSSGLELTSWMAPRRLDHFKKYLWGQMKSLVGDFRYNWLFEEAEPLSGEPGTTRSLHRWFSRLAAHINDGVMPPAVCALTLCFLMAPNTSAVLATPTPDLFTSANVLLEGSEEAVGEQAVEECN